jgi:hypothetical protein
VTTTLTTKGPHIGAKYALRRTDYRTGLLSLHAGGLYTVELENRQPRKSLVGSNPTPLRQSYVRSRLADGRLRLTFNGFSTFEGPRQPRPDFSASLLKFNP